MPVETLPFDAAEFLTDAKSQAELLADTFESGHAGYITNALGIVARARGMSTVSRDTEVSRMGLYKALSKGGNPQLTTLLAIVKALGFQLSIKMLDTPNTAASTGRQPDEAAE